MGSAALGSVEQYSVQENLLLNVQQKLTMLLLRLKLCGIRTVIRCVAIRTGASV